MTNKPVFTEVEFSRAAVANATAFLLDCVLCDSYRQHPEDYDPDLHRGMFDDLIRLPITARQDGYFGIHCRVSNDNALRTFCRTLLKNPTLPLDPFVAAILGLAEDATNLDLIHTLLEWAARKDLMFSDMAIHECIHATMRVEDGEDELRSQAEEIADDVLTGVIADDEATRKLVN